MNADHLHHEAARAADQAYAPYSHYPVGAAVLSETGAVYTGCNVENKSLGLTVCAERVAIFNAISDGAKSIQALAVHTSDGAMPCGACRQVLLEFGRPETTITVKREGILESRLLSDLLPEAFDSTF